MWVVGLSLKPNDVLMRSTGGLLAPPFTVKNYTDITATSAVFGWMLNSTIVAIGQTVLMLIVAYLVGYRIHTSLWEALLAFGVIVGVGYVFTWVSAFAGLTLKTIEAVQAAAARRKAASTSSHAPPSKASTPARECRCAVRAAASASSAA